MVEEARSLAALDILVHSKSTQGDSADLAPAWERPHRFKKVDAVAIGQADIGHKDIQREGPGDIDRGRNTGGRGHLVTAADEQAMERVGSVAMIFYQQQTERDRGWGWRCGLLWRRDMDRAIRSRKGDDKCRALAGAGAFGLNGAVVIFGNGLANR